MGRPPARPGGIGCGLAKRDGGCKSLAPVGQHGEAHWAIHRRTSSQVFDRGELAVSRTTDSSRLSRHQLAIGSVTDTFWGSDSFRGTDGQRVVVEGGVAMCYRILESELSSGHYPNPEDGRMCGNRNHLVGAVDTHFCS